MIRMIASLEGYVNRKSTGPKTQTLWLGLQQMYDLATCLALSAPLDNLESNWAYMVFAGAFPSGPLRP